MSLCKAAGSNVLTTSIGSSACKYLSDVPSRVSSDAMSKSIVMSVSCIRSDIEIVLSRSTASFTDSMSTGSYPMASMNNLAAVAACSGVIACTVVAAVFLVLFEATYRS